MRHAIRVWEALKHKDAHALHACFVQEDQSLPAPVITLNFERSSTPWPWDVETLRATAQFRQQVGAAIAQGLQHYDAAVNYRAGAGTTLASARTTLPPHTRSISEPLADYIPPDSNPPDQPSISISGGD